MFSGPKILVAALAVVAGTAVPPAQGAMLDVFEPESACLLSQTLAITCVELPETPPITGDAPPITMAVDARTGALVRGSQLLRHLLMVSGEEDLTVIGIDWDKKDFKGKSHVWAVDDPNGCRVYEWYVDGMPPKWNDRVSSAKGYAGCTRYLHFEHAGRTGAVLPCVCPTMGVMDNETSSEEWRRG